MFKKFTNGCVRVVNRWLPDAFLFAIILSIIVFIGSMCATKMGPLQVLNAWGDSKGFWGLLSFSMQMALVLVFGSAMAAAKPCKRPCGLPPACATTTCRPSWSPPSSPPSAAG